MDISKDTLENMALILRGYGYEVTLKESKTKKPYIKNRFNKIRDLNLKNLSYNTCLFLNETVIEDFKLHDYDAASQDVTIGYIGNNEDDNDIENILIKTSRVDTNNCGIKEMLRKYDYVIKLSDIFKLMTFNKNLNA